jgi:hypothetical protein
MTLFIAIWGAVLGTMTFFWNLWKWHQENPRIVATVQTIESSWSEGGFAGIRLILRNRGGEKTTVEKIFFNQRPRWFELGLCSVLLRLRGEVKDRQNMGVSNPKTVQLPVVLDVNGVWEGFVPLELNDPDNEEEIRQIEINHKLVEALKSGVLRYSIQCSHKKNRIRGVVGAADDSMKE